ncbi:putative virion structural protein [Erwinia phage vB_EamM_Stratton]|uniref:Putative virion structural protein n=1 Tax=Erwinia phage vB_EamM_Stratton TaxID=1883378 RepID=A0A1B2IH44_9CAUD|nr:putative virion structural protein [Erwinia phage vB_EamM_Stratton]
MTIRLSWVSQASKNLTAIEIYRKVGYAATIDVNAPGTPYKTLSPTATEFIENVTDLTEKTIYSYWVVGVKDTERLFGGRIVQGFFLDTGPGPQTILRGDWYCGYFGPVAAADFFTTAEIKALLTTTQAGVVSNEPGTWYKFIYLGKIIFVPATQHGQNILANIYNRGMMFGTDDNGNFVPPGASATKQDVRISKNGRSYRIRLPRGDAYDGKLDQINGEWFSTMGRMFLTSIDTSKNVDANGVGRGKMGSLAVLGNSGNQYDTGAQALTPMYSASTIFFAYGYRPDTWSTTSSLSSNVGYSFVFELILP